MLAWNWAGLRVRPCEAQGSLTWCVRLQAILQMRPLNLKTSHLVSWPCPALFHFTLNAGRVQPLASDPVDKSACQAALHPGHHSVLIWPALV